MFGNTLFELFMVLSIMVVVVILYLVFTRRCKASKSSKASVVEKFEELTDFLDKKTLMQMGKLKLTDISSKRLPLVGALKDLKGSAEGFISSIDKVIRIVGDDTKTYKKKQGQEADEPEEDEDEPEEDEDEPEEADDEPEEADDEPEEDDDEPEEDEEVEGFVDPRAHGYMSL